MVEWTLIYFLTLCPPGGKCQSTQLTIPMADEASCLALARSIRLDGNTHASARCVYVREPGRETGA